MKTQIAGLVALFTTMALPVLAQDTQMTLHKDPYCGCCTAWADLAAEAGYQVTTVETEDIAATKLEAGVPEAFWSCHTTRIGGYVIEGHVPLDAVARLLETRPDISGIAVPGMPAGSPGMGDDPAASYDVVAWGGDAGEGAIYQQVRGK
ncbi:Uncharacterized conserved protein [Paracoccus halophilus]|uniref:Uncharacterized conserved protein n=1 Tax=Paracoccus halophilus TaxID=376733 RepID=A0A099EZL8_9RHOB|nr:DUF411 domain-containing protein [Paracoccus halophilus]KGJ03362.1 hypothetical protein IT41_14445 [Paracoccus halophilus]SFA58868.1 Uncharacterized conserved protein [Paracoccus halophilus]